MANIQTESFCAGGIEVASSAVYTMIRLPEGTRGSSGFNREGSLFYDTGTKSIVVIDAIGDYYEVEMVNFTDI